MQESKKDTFHTGTFGIDMDCIIKDILKEWWVILLFAVSAALFAGAWAKYTYTPQYETTTTFAVGKSGFSSTLAYDNLNSAKNVTTKFKQVAESSVLQKRVCEELDMDTFPAEVEVNVIESSNLMTMKVTAASPRDAYRIIHSVMDNTRELTNELMDTVAVKVLMEPQVPSAPVRALNAEGAMKKAAKAAGLFMVVMFGLLSYFKDTIKNAGDAAEKLDAKLLGTIWYEKKYLTRKERRAGKKTALNIENPMLSFAYVEAIGLMATKVRMAMDRRGAQVVLVTSVSENEGKSTVAANLALALRQEEKKVLLMDCDFRKPSQYKIFEVPHEQLQEIDFAEALLGRQDMKIQKAGEDQTLRVLYSVKPHQNLLNNRTLGVMRSLLQILKTQADYIVIDTAPLAMAADGEVLAELADSSILVVQQDMMEARYINDALDQLNRTNAKVLGCVFNNVHRGVLSRTREYGQYYGAYGYGGYGKYGRYSHNDKSRSRKGKQVEE